jgi:hypothetical protein
MQQITDQNQPQLPSPTNDNPPIRHFVDCWNDFRQTRNRGHFEQAKKQLIEYYRPGGQYEQDVAHICTAAITHFSSIRVSPNSAVIFDIDDTAIYCYQNVPELKDIYQNNAVLSHLHLDECPAILPVLTLYTFLIRRGFKIIFLSRRKANDNMIEITIKNLRSAGYTTWEELILFSQQERNIRDYNIRDYVENWKHTQREKLSEKYLIAGCVGDQKGDFHCPRSPIQCICGYNGYEVRLPNYLY